MKPRGIWPEKIRKALKQFNPLGQTIGNELAGGPSRDVTAESIELIEAFAPDLAVLGKQLKDEIKGTFAGVQYRVVKNENDTQRCLQYVYIYTKQLGAVSFLWMVAVPLLMAFWGLWVQFSFPAEILLALQAFENGTFLWLLPLTDVGIPFWLTGGVWLPILFAGIFPHIIDYWNMPRGRWFYIRSTTLLILFGAVQLLAFANIIVSFALIVLAGIFFVYWVLEKKKIGPSAHDMDYAPVFVWIEEAHQKGKKIPPEKSNPDHWKFESACWDYYHYLGVRKSEEEMEKNWIIYVAKYLKYGRRIRLLMDNPWHSFAMGSQVRFFYKASAVALPTLLVISIVLQVSGLYNDLYPLSVWMFVLIGFLLVLSGRNVARYPSELVEEWSNYLPEAVEDPTHSEVYKMYHLNDEKLREIWNLREKKARLVIISKMQDPFHLRSDFYENFRDESEYLLYDYGVMDRISKLETEVAMSNVRYSQRLRETGEVEESEEVLKRVVELKPDFIEGWTELGNLYVESNREDDIADLIKQAGEQRPDIKGRLSHELGKTFEKSGKFEEEADRAYVQAVEVESQKADPEFSLRLWIEENPDNPILWEKLADILEERGLLDEAKEARERAKEAKQKKMS
ncbi:MAG: hypothetical protein ACW97A_06465 [Candidatus Thorarchaeota archaeon]|jgi:tetratricopeptide (TPR) repeat protein